MPCKYFCMAFFILPLSLPPLGDQIMPAISVTRSSPVTAKRFGFKRGDSSAVILPFPVAPASAAEQTAATVELLVRHQHQRRFAIIMQSRIARPVKGYIRHLLYLDEYGQDGHGFTHLSKAQRERIVKQTQSGYRGH